MADPPESRSPLGGAEVASIGRGYQPIVPGVEVGSYHILDELGEGGMGEVFLAEQLEPVRRKVAVKVIKPGLANGELLARFEAEREALARMDHPAIARVLDAGSCEDGRPFFALEYVPGRPITEYCDDYKLSLEERLQLYLEACAGVQHAHQKAVIHRDLKPSNILVGERDGERFIKIIDFGVAKATVGRLVERTMFTEAGQLIGTPEYISPEQAEMSGRDVDTRTDIYALGVVLYELLCGALPMDPTELRDSGWGEILRRIREEEPKSLGQRFSDLGEERQLVAAKRSTSVEKLTSRLNGEVAWIVAKALEKDRNRRYDTARGLALDVERSLRGEAVLAVPPSAGYRLRKLVQRHRAAFGAGVVVFIALISGLGMAWWGRAQARAERDRAVVAQERAEGEARKAEEVVAFLQGVFRGADPRATRGREVTARQLLDQGVADLEGAFGDRPVVKSAVLEAAAAVYREIGDFDLARSLLEESLALLEGIRDSTDPDLGRVLGELGDLLRQLDRFSEAEELLQRAALTLGPLTEESFPRHAKHYNDLGLVYRRLDRLADAERSLRHSLELRERHFGARSPQVATALHNLSLVVAQEDPQEGIRLQERALELRRELLGDNHPRIASSLTSLAVKYVNRGELEPARALVDEAIGIFDRLGLENDFLANAANLLGRVQFESGEVDAAEASYLRARDVMERTQGRESVLYVGILAGLAELYERRGQLEEAEASHGEALFLVQRIHDGPHVDVYEVQFEYGGFLARLGRIAEARSMLTAARDGYLAARGPDDRTTRGATRALDALP